MTLSSNAIKTGIVLLGLSLAACSSTPKLENGREAAYDEKTQFPITVEPHMETLLLSYDGTGPLDPNTSAQLARFAKGYIDAGSGSIAISAPSRYPNAPSDYAQKLISLGVPGTKILIGATDASANGDVIKLTYIRYQASTKTCGDWSADLADTESNETSPNFGCATQQNLAAEIADPRDLVAPGSLDEDDAQRRLVVLQKYRKGETTTAVKTQDQSGAISDVATGGGGM